MKTLQNTKNMQKMELGYVQFDTTVMVQFDAPVMVFTSYATRKL